MDFLDLLAAHPPLFIGCCAVLGLLVGSFLNVVIYRLPVMIDNGAACANARSWRAADGAQPRPAKPVFNLVVPRSACP